MRRFLTALGWGVLAALFTWGAVAVIDALIPAGAPGSGAGGDAATFSGNVRVGLAVISPWLIYGVGLVTAIVVFARRRKG